MNVSFHNLLPSSHYSTPLPTTKIFEQLSSGKRINQAADDPASLSISTKFRAQIRGLQMAERNSQDGISLLQVAEGAVSNVQSVLQRIRELSVQAANDTLTTSDRTFIQSEVNELVNHIHYISQETSFNTIKLFRDDIKSNSTNLTVKAGEVKLATTITIPEGHQDKLVVRGLFDQTSGVLFPDIYIKSPTDEYFGWYPSSGRTSKLNDYGTSNNGGAMEDKQNSSSDFAYYSGWAANPEYMEFENPVSGTWEIYAQSLGASKDTDFTIAYDFSSPKTFTFQVGPNAGDHYSVKMSNISPVALGIDEVSLLTSEDSQKSIGKIDAAMDYVLSELGKYGAHHNALESTIRGNTTYELNLVQADARITDMDMAKGVMEYTRQELLQQVDTSLHVYKTESSLRFVKLLFGTSS